MAVESIFQNQHFQWIDVFNPQPQDLFQLNQDYQINQLLLEDTLNPDHLPKYDEAGDVKFFLTREHRPDQVENPGTINEVSTKFGIFVLDDHLVTVHRTKTKTISDLLDQLKISNKKDKITLPQLVLRLGKRILHSYDYEAEYLDDILDEMENQVFMAKRPSKDLIKQMYRIKRRINVNLRVVNLSSDWVQNFHNLDLERVEVQDITDDQRNDIANFERLNARITSLIELYLALNDEKNNEAMKILSVYSVYFLPITFIVGLYGMNFEHMPELRYKFAYYIVLAVMFVIVLITFFYLKKKRF